MTKVLITRSRKQSLPFAETLKRTGFEPVFFPTIQIRPLADLSGLEEALKNVEKYDWVIFTSANAADVFFENIPKEKAIQSLSGGLNEGEARSRRADLGERRPSTTSFSPKSPPLRNWKFSKVAAVGTKTAERLKAHGVKTNLIPDKFVGEGLLQSLGDVQGKRFLLPRAKVARKILPAEIRKAGGILDEFAIYETVTATPTDDEIAALRAGVDVVTFTSPSTVKNFVKLAKAAQHNPFDFPLFACIGPVTEKAAREAGFSPIVMAETYTTDGLIEIITQHTTRNIS